MKIRKRKIVVISFYERLFVFIFYVYVYVRLTFLRSFFYIFYFTFFLWKKHFMKEKRK